MEVITHDRSKLRLPRVVAVAVAASLLVAALASARSWAQGARPTLRPAQPSQDARVGDATAMSYPLKGYRLVSGSYVRMHEAGVLAAMAQQVADGKLPQATLERMVGKSEAAALVKMDWTDPAVRRVIVPVPSAGAIPAGVRATAGLSWESLRQVVPVPPLQLPANEYGPGSISLGDHRIGTVITRTIDVTCPADSVVTASPANGYGGDVQCTGLTSYDGVWTPTPGHLSPYPHVANKAGAGQSLSAMAGQELTVDVRVTSGDVNVISTNVTITGLYGGRSWKAVIPVKATFTLLGPLKEIIAVPDRDVAAVEGESVQVPVSLLNLTPTAVAATVSVNNLPGQVTVQPVTVTAAAESTTSTTLTFVVNQQATQAIGQTVDLVVNAPGLNESHNQMALSVYDPIHEYYPPSAITTSNALLDGVTVGIESDGTWYMQGMVVNLSGGDETAIVGFSFPGQTNGGQFQSFGVPKGTDQATDSTGASEWILDNYLSAVTMTPDLSLYIQTH